MRAAEAEAGGGGGCCDCWPCCGAGKAKIEAKKAAEEERQKRAKKFEEASKDSKVEVEGPGLFPRVPSTEASATLGTLTPGMPAAAQLPGSGYDPQYV